MEDNREVKVEDKVHPATDHESPEAEMYSSTLPSTSVPDGLGRREEMGSTEKKIMKQNSNRNIRRTEGEREMEREDVGSTK
jgi:hypothetical protein